MNNTELRMRTARGRLQHWLKERELARIAHDRAGERHADAIIAECEESIVGLERQLILSAQAG
jgi:hypothetical protein